MGTPRRQVIAVSKSRNANDHLAEFRKSALMPGSEDTVPRRLISATDLAKFVYCAKAWELKYVRGAESSAEAQQLQIEGNAWHAAQGRQLARSNSFRLAAFVALTLAIILFVFVWMGWAR